MSHNNYITLLDQIIKQKGDHPPHYKTLIRQNHKNQNQFNVKLIYINYLIISNAEDEETAKQTAAKNLLFELSNNNNNLNFINSLNEKSDERLQNLCAQQNLSQPQYTAVKVKNSQNINIWLAICSVESIKRTGISNTSKEAKNLAALKVILMLISTEHLNENYEESISDCLQNTHISFQEPSTSFSSSHRNPLIMKNKLQTTGSKKLTKIPIHKHNNLSCMSSNIIEKQKMLLDSSQKSNKTFKKCIKCGYRTLNPYFKF